MRKIYGFGATQGFGFGRGNVSSSCVPIYISFNSGSTSSPKPSGVADINDISNQSDTTTVYSLVDAEGNANDATIQLLDAWQLSDLGTKPGDDSGCASDYELENAWRTSEATAHDFKLYIPAGTFDILISSSSDNTETNNLWSTAFTLDGITKMIDACPNTTSGYCETWTITSTGQYFTLETLRISAGYYSLINSIRITEV